MLCDRFKNFAFFVWQGSIRVQVEFENCSVIFFKKCLLKTVGLQISRSLIG